MTLHARDGNPRASSVGHLRLCVPVGGFRLQNASFATMLQSVFHAMISDKMRDAQLGDKVRGSRRQGTTQTEAKLDIEVQLNRCWHQWEKAQSAA